MFPGGLLICTHTAPSTSQVTTSEGSLFRTGNNTWIYPSQFVNKTPEISASVLGNAVYSWTALGSWGTHIAAHSWSVIRTDPLAANPIVSLTAIGRWK
jgi:hypothetical protein